MFVVANYNVASDTYLSFGSVYDENSEYFEHFVRFLNGLLYVREFSTEDVIVSFNCLPGASQETGNTAHGVSFVNVRLDRKEFHGPRWKQRWHLANTVLRHLAQLHPERANLCEWGRRYFDNETESLQGSCPDNGIVIPANIRSTLADLETWNALSGSERARVASRIHAELCAQRPWFTYAMSHARICGSDVYFFEENETGVPFCLVPGGSFVPGFGAERLRKLEVLFHSFLFEWHAQDQRQRALTELSQWDAPVNISPLLFAVDPMLADRQHVISSVDSYVRPTPPFYSKDDNLVLNLDWSIAWQTLKLLHWSLPTVFEFQWAQGGGQPTLFYWGDHPNDVMFEIHQNKEHPYEGPVEKEMWPAVDPRMPRGQRPTYPVWNQFGLRKIATFGGWCQPEGGIDDPTPLRAKDGAGDGWQACGEWLGFLTPGKKVLAVFGDTGIGPKNCIRPVIRLKDAQRS